MNYIIPILFRTIMAVELIPATDFYRATGPDGTPVALPPSMPIPGLDDATAGATTSVASSATPVPIKAANTARRGIVISNDSTAILYVLLGAGTVSSSFYTYAIAAKATVAPSLNITGYKGIITGVWASANGAALVTELT